MDPVTLVVGSALGAAFEILFSAVLKAKSTANMFQTHLGNLNATLDSLKPVIIQLESANRLVPLEKSLENFTTKMEEGKQLVDECCEVWRINLIKQHKYTGKIEALDDSLHRLLSILSVQLGSHSAMMLHRIGGNVVAQNKNQIGVRCAVPPLPSVIVGLDAPLDDLEMKLLGDGTESILVLTAAGGCGKTTLATMFCHDPRVKDKFKENIFFATVSNKVSYLIVQELCEHVGLEVPALHVYLLDKLNLLDMYCCSNIKELPEEIGEMSSLRKIKMVQCLRLLALPASVLNLEQLREVICDEDTENLWGEPFKSSLKNIDIRVVKEDFKRSWLHNL